MGLWENFKNIMTIPDEDEYEDEGTFETADETPRKKETSKKAESPKIIKSKNYNAPAQKAQMQVVLVVGVLSLADTLQLDLDAYRRARPLLRCEIVLANKHHGKGHDQRPERGRASRLSRKGRNAHPSALL